ncbi:[protein-PII] uridylyltransferase [Azonexus sp.]|uniref:[protein-PII] uridylyltransferase n=1 Tax=Azonexus sp. TaxID=1872668 RepID=UPI0039E4BBF4
MLFPVAALRQRSQAQRHDRETRYAQDNDAAALLRARAEDVDALLSELWTLSRFPVAAALAAVGGYGRGELYPASDIDLLILLPQTASAATAKKIDALLACLWDLGLEIGHSVRTIDECLIEAAGDLSVQTALSEARLLAGNSKIFGRFEKQFRRHLNARNFYDAKLLEQKDRHQRHDETPYSLEPNIKEAPGGLRDLHTLLWIARVAGFGTTWAELATSGMVSPEGQILGQQLEDFLHHLRIRLHLLSGRREERLRFDYQRSLAMRYGYADNSEKLASEQLMQVYYRNAKTLVMFNTIVLQNMEYALFPENRQHARDYDADFELVGNQLAIRQREDFKTRPQLIFKAFRALQQNPTLNGMTAPTLRSLWHARHLIDDAFRADPVNRRLFLELLQNDSGVVSEFRRMNQLDILGAYLPNFGRIVGQMQHDLFHAYTVDQHSLQVLRNLRRFTLSEFAHEYPECSRIINAFERPWLLYIAALFHDIAKGRGGDHSEKGTVDAAEFCAQHGLSADDSELIVWLVRQHLRMSLIAQKEDTHDPEVIARFAALVGDVRHLQALYLLTHADIRGTSPKVWNEWKGKLLADLYQATLHHLSGDESPAAHGIIAERQAEAMRQLRFFALSDTVHERLWRQLDTVYFLRHSAEEIAWHTRALHYRIHNQQPVVRARLGELSNSVQVMVYTLDQPDLFARLAGFFARAGYSVVDAKIHTTAHGYALDSFVLLAVEAQEVQRETLDYIEHELEQRLRRQLPPEAPSAVRLSRQLRHFPIKPEVSVRPDDKGTHYVLSLVAADRPGLLYLIAQTLAEHGVQVHTAKIATLGERAEDVFLVSGADLNDPARRIRLETVLMERLQV